MIATEGVLSREEMEKRRLAAADELLANVPQSKVATKYGVSRTTASRWARALTTMVSKGCANGAPPDGPAGYGRINSLNSARSTPKALSSPGSRATDGLRPSWRRSSNRGSPSITIRITSAACCISWGFVPAAVPRPLRPMCLPYTLRIWIAWRRKFPRLSRSVEPRRGSAASGYRVPLRPR